MNSADVNMGTTLRAPTRWSVIEALGHDIGCAAGGIVLLLLWTFAITWSVRGR